MQHIFAGGDGDPDGWYCRTGPFEAGDSRYRWLNHAVLVGVLRPPTRGDQVVIDVYRVS